MSMQSITKRDEPAKHQSAPAGKGTPATASALSARKDVTVRVSVSAPAAPEAEELKEHGYGHGV